MLCASGVGAGSCEGSDNTALGLGLGMGLGLGTLSLGCVSAMPVHCLYFRNNKIESNKPPENIDGRKSDVGEAQQMPFGNEEASTHPRQSSERTV
jgi:hypothetical protein